MDTPARQHRREQLREAQRRSRQRRQEAMEALTQQNRQLVNELERIRAIVRELVDLAWDRWTTGDISNELLERLVALSNSISDSATSSVAGPSYDDPTDSPYGHTHGSASLSERSSMPFAETPDPSIFRDDRQSYAQAPSIPPLSGAGSIAQLPQITQPEQDPNAPPEGTVSLFDIERNPRIAFCSLPSPLYNPPAFSLIDSNFPLSQNFRSAVY